MTSKYRNVRTEVDGITFDSKKEARYYQELLLREKAGEVDDIQLQPEFVLHAWCPRGTPAAPGARAAPIGRYIADFAYRDISEETVYIVDVKGVRTPFYKWKKKHVEAEHGIVITEV